LHIALRFQGEQVLINGDSNRLAQVIVNLIDNALRHTSAHGSVSVAVEPGDIQARLTVRDTGIGIPYNDLPHIFERFYVVDRSRARESSGTGLGLSIVKQIVEAHGGSVIADSELGRGAVFTCAFPLGRTS
jgi:signal transduction histidine kinase